jgi:hypothetical protein
LQAVLHYDLSNRPQVDFFNPRASIVTHQLRHHQPRFSHRDKAGRPDAPRNRRGIFRRTRWSASPPHRPAGRTCGPACFSRDRRSARCRSRRPHAVVEALSILLQPGGAFAARNAPAAAFMRVKLHDAQREFHHAGSLRPSQRCRPNPACFSTFARNRSPWRCRTHRPSRDRARRSAGHHRFQLLPVTHAAADFVDHAHQIESDGQFVDTRFIDVAGEADQARTAVLRSPEPAQRRAAVANDRQGSQRTFRRCSGPCRRLPGARPPPGTADGCADCAAFALDGIQQRGLFTALIRTRAECGVKIEIRSRCLGYCLPR